MRHLVIPDTQVKIGVSTDHIKALGNYILDQRPDVIVMLGDWWDMASLNSYEKPGSKFFEGVTYKDDVQAGIDAMESLLRPLRAYQAKTRKNRKKRYNPRLVFLMGNHEHRINRALEQDPRLVGALDLGDLRLQEFGWEVHPFLRIVEIDGILYSHYFVNTNSLKKGPLSGTIDNKLLKVGQSFTMGHQQHLQYGIRHTNTGKVMRGLVCGAFYSHNEPYLGEQGNHYWRGVIVKHEVRDGDYDPMFVSLDYLVRKWL